jgi:hypothetical protein
VRIKNEVDFSCTTRRSEMRKADIWGDARKAEEGKEEKGRGQALPFVLLLSL